MNRMNKLTEGTNKPLHGLILSIMLILSVRFVSQTYSLRLDRIEFAARDQLLADASRLAILVYY